MLSTTNQLTSTNFIQLGSADMPCRVRFALSDKFDLKSNWRAISVSVPADAEQVFNDFDDEHKGAIESFGKVIDGQFMLRVKVSARKTLVVDSDDSTITIDALCPDDTCMIIAKPVKWTRDGTTGYSLHVAKLKVVDDSDFSDLKFV
jgi:hypothetical protein